MKLTVLEFIAGFGLNAAVTPFGKPEAAKATFPENPFTGVIVMLVVPVAPCGAVTALGAAESVNRSFWMTVSVIGVLAVKLPEVPVTVSVSVSGVAVSLGLKVSVLVEVVELGLKEAVTPLGKPETDRFTLPLKCPCGTTVMVLVAL